MGSKALFGGGTNGFDSNIIDIYDSASGLWSIATLSQARSGLAAASVGSKVLFAGGINITATSNVVDIYDDRTGLWSTTTLSQARSYLAAAVVGSKVTYHHLIGVQSLYPF